MKLCLGTVQFGLDYGVFNTPKKDKEYCIKCLEYAFDNGINEFLYISLDIVPIIGMVDIEVEMMYRGNKEKANLTIDPYYPNSSQPKHYYNIIKPYTEGDLQILDYIIKKGVIVVEKDSSN